MNLIDRLGGYKNSKGIREAYVSNGWSVSDVCKGFHEYFTIEDLDCALLEYRRQHNIFEVGDWIVIDSYKPEYQFYQITKDDMDSHWINLVEFRHATPEEIAAGRRL